MFTFAERRKLCFHHCWFVSLSVRNSSEKNEQMDFHEILRIVQTLHNKWQWKLWIQFISKPFHIGFCLYLFSIFLFCIWYQQLQWRHNGRNGVSNHQPLNCLLNRLCRRTSNKTSKHRWPVNSPHKGPVMRKMFPFDVVIMITEKQVNGLLWHFQDMSGMTQITSWKTLGMLHLTLGYRILLYYVDLRLLATSQKKRVNEFY